MTMPERSVTTRDLRVIAGVAALVSVGSALALLFGRDSHLGYELLRTIADGLASDGEASNFHSAFHPRFMVYPLQATAVMAGTVAVVLFALSDAIPPLLPKLMRSRVSPFVWIGVFACLLLVLELLDLHEEGWDESTFIIMASHVLEGNLPYLELFDLKPPGIFLALAGVMGVFGENLPAVHLFGAFCLLVAATAGYAIAARQTTPLMAGIAMTVFCALTDEGEFQETSTEHLVLAFMMPACWLIVARRELWAVFLAGVLISAATLTRTNMAYVALAVGGFYLWRFARPRSGMASVVIAVYIAGGALPLTLLFFVYWLADGVDALVLATFVVPLSFASSQLSIVQAFVLQAGYWLECVVELPFIFLPATIFVGGVIRLGRAAYRGESAILLLVLVAVAMSILGSGAAWGHYLLQTLPLASILAVVGFSSQPRGVLLCLGLSGLIVAGVIFEAGRDGFVPYRKSSMERAADVIREDLCCGELVYAPRHHLIYWYLKQPPPTSIIHPTALTQDAIMNPLAAHGYVAADEWRRVFERDIGYIVLDPDDWRDQRQYSVEQEQYLADVLDGFQPWRQIGRLVVSKKKGGMGS